MATTILRQHHFRDLLLKLKLMGYIHLLSQLVNPKLFQKLQYLNHSHRNLILSLAMIHTKTIQQPWAFFMWSSTLERFHILGLLLTNYSLHPKVKLNYSPLTLRTGTSLSREFSPYLLSCIHLSHSMVGIGPSHILSPYDSPRPCTFILFVFPVAHFVTMAS